MDLVELCRSAFGPLLAFLLPLLFRKGRELYGKAWKLARSRITTVGDLARVMASTRDEIKDDIREVRTELHTMRTEANRRESVMRVRLEKPDAAVFEADPEGKLTIADETLQRWTGRPMHVLRGRGFLSIIAHEEQAAFQAAFNNAITDGREFRASVNMSVIGSPTDTGGNQIRHIPTDWRVRPVFDEYEPSRPLVAFVGEVRRRASLPGTEVQAAPARILNLPRAHTGD